MELAIESSKTLIAWRLGFPHNGDLAIVGCPERIANQNSTKANEHHRRNVMNAVAGFVWWLLGTDRFWSLLGTFIGALLGIPAGFWVYRWSSRHADRERRTQLLSSLQQAVKHNIDLVGEVEKWIGQEEYRYFNVDLTLLESTASLKYELLDIDLCREIDHVRFELSHLGRKVDALLNLQINPWTGATHTILRKGLVEAIKVHLDPLKKTLSGLQDRLSS
jgi:hypothetical protein